MEVQFHLHNTSCFVGETLKGKVDLNTGEQHLTCSGVHAVLFGFLKSPSQKKVVVKEVVSLEGQPRNYPDSNLIELYKLHKSSLKHGHIKAMRQKKKLPEASDLLANKFLHKSSWDFSFTIPPIINSFASSGKSMHYFVAFLIHTSTETISSIRHIHVSWPFRDLQLVICKDETETLTGHVSPAFVSLENAPSRAITITTFDNSNDVFTHASYKIVQSCTLFDKNTKTIIKEEKVDTRFGPIKDVRTINLPKLPVSVFGKIGSLTYYVNLILKGHRTVELSLPFIIVRDRLQSQNLPVIRLSQALGTPLEEFYELVEMFEMRSANREKRGSRNISGSNSLSNSQSSSNEKAKEINDNIDEYSFFNSWENSFKYQDWAILSQLANLLIRRTPSKKDLILLLYKYFNIIGELNSFLGSGIKTELALLSEVSVSFRGDSVTSRLGALLFKDTCDPFLKSVLKPVFLDEPCWSSAEDSMSIDPQVVGPEKAQKNFKLILRSVDALLKQIIDKFEQLPEVVQELFFTVHCELHSRVEKSLMGSMRFKAEPQEVVNMVNSFFFLRLICPALVDPLKSWAGEGQAQWNRAQIEGLACTAKVLQSLANQKNFLSKTDLFFHEMNLFMEKQNSKMTILLQLLLAGSKKSSTRAAVVLPEKAEEVLKEINLLAHKIWKETEASFFKKAHTLANSTNDPKFSPTSRRN